MTNELVLNNKFELHYFFSEDDISHSIDANTRHKCEHELLQIIYEITKSFDSKVKVETEAYKEGGVKEIWSFLSSDNGQLTIIISLLTLILSRIPLSKTKLEKKDLKLSIKERKLNIKLLEEELKAKKIPESKIDIDKIEVLVNNNYKVIKHKSNFYKQLFRYPKVKKISTAILNSKNEIVEEAKIVERKDFENFILDSDDLDSITDENATIEIISPVLKKGSYKWRGVYNEIGIVIEFTMKDKLFKNSIIDSGVTFKSGTFIDCVLKIERKIDDLGNIFNSNYSVLTVIKQHNDGVSIETPQGKAYKKRKIEQKQQLLLFEDYEIK